MSEPFDFDTRAVRAGTERSAFNEHSEALFLTSSFVFGSAAQAAARFSGAEPGYVYSRFSNPTVTMFERRLASLEGAEDCLATSSGMAALMATCLAVLKAGDHVICAANVFGATVQLFSTVLARFGVEVTYVRATDPAAWRAAATPRTRLLFCETPSNPADGDRRPRRVREDRSRDRRRDASSTTASARRSRSGRSSSGSTP